jgi:pyruvate dehydrogenase E1 component alpha subunit
MDADAAIALFRVMQLIRSVEKAASQLVIERHIGAALHVAIGQEAVAAGACGALREGDTIVSTHRGHGHYLAKGGAIEPLFAELMGRAGGVNGGRSGSMHLADPSVGLLGANGIVGGGLPIAVGSAYAAQVLGEERVVLCFFGEGAAAEGACHEAMNLAGIWKLPIVFLCENNAYAEMTPFEVHSPVSELSIRAAGYGMAGVTVDGNDVLAVLNAATEAVARARAGDGPTYLEAKTYRISGHFVGDPERYKPKDEADTWRARDPIARLRAQLGDDPALAEIETQLEQQIATAVASALATAKADPATLLAHVYATGGQV